MKIKKGTMTEDRTMTDDRTMTEERTKASPRRGAWMAALALSVGFVLAGCQSGGGGAPAPTTVESTVTLCSATVPEPDASEEACQEVAFAYEPPAGD